MDMDILKVSPDNIVIIFILFSIEQIHLNVLGSVPCPSAASFIVSVFHQRPTFMSRTTPKTIVLYGNLASRPGLSL
jgi:hypothetical protein